MLKKQLASNNKDHERKNPNLEFGEIHAKMKTNTKHTLARYSTQIRNKLDRNKVYNSIYYLTGDSYSLVVYELSEDEESIEKYVWTTKSG